MKSQQKYILVAIIIVSTTLFSRAQNIKIDSLQSTLKTQADDTGKVKTLNELSTLLSESGNYVAALSSGNAALELAEKLSYKKGSANACNNCGIVFWNQGNYPKAFDMYLKALDINKEIGDKKGIAYTFGNLGLLYDEQGNYAKALDYYNQTLALSVEIGDKKSISNANNSIGIIYEEQKNYPKALECYKTAMAIDSEIGYKYGIAGDLGNIGVIFADENKPEEAQAYSFKALSIYRELNNKNSIAIDLGNIGDTYVQLRNFLLAEAYLDSALKLSLEIGNIEALKGVYESFTILDSATGNYKKAFYDHEKFKVYSDSLINRESVKKITQMEIQHEFEWKEEHAKALQEKKNIITYSAIVILFLILILATLAINRQQIKRRKDKQLYEKEKQHMEEELASSKIMLDNYLKSMVEKNDLLEKFKTDIEKLKILKVKEIDENRLENLENLSKTTILTDDDWDKFKVLFEQVYKGFFIRLKEKLPDLTQADIRLVCLSKLKLDTRQMAGILGVSTDAIKKGRYRLRKKLGLSGDDNIDEIDISI